jgi:hypothetical protein
MGARTFVTSLGVNMAKAFSALVLFVLAGCTGLPSLPQAQYTASPCAAGESTYACQVERYHNISVQ